MTNANVERRGFRVVGHVQGVGYRWSAAREADALGLRGSIRNLPDGTVEVSAEGAVETLDQFEAWLAKGPRGASVSRVDVTEAKLPIPETGFQIVR